VVFSTENLHYGYCRVWALLGRESFEVNWKRVYRLWGEEGLKVPQKQRKRQRFADGAKTGALEGGPSTRVTSGPTTSL